MVAIEGITTNVYKVLVARAIRGEDVDLEPYIFAVGDGASFTDGEPDPPEPGDTALRNQRSQSVVTLHEVVGYENRVVGVIPGGEVPLTINECAFFTRAGVMVARATLNPATFQAPVDYEETLLVQPELG